jgi:hypothetical protein
VRRAANDRAPGAVAATRREVLAGAAAVAALPLVASPLPAVGLGRPLFDAHIHYNGEIAAILGPEQAAQRLRDAGIVRAIVSSTPDRLTLDLMAAAPDIVIPFLRPYRTHGDRGGWLINTEVLAEVERRLDLAPYGGIGEFHVNPLAPSGSILPRLVDLARERKLWILAHVAAGVIDQIMALDPDARVIWAHAGGLVEPAETVATYIARYPALCLELSLRSGLTVGEEVTDTWRAIFAAARGRVLLGTDTWTNSRWDEIVGEANYARRWLARLPPDLADEIAVGSGRRMFG